MTQNPNAYQIYVEQRQIPCPQCGGLKVIPNYPVGDPLPNYFDKYGVFETRCDLCNGFGYLSYAKEPY